MAGSDARKRASLIVTVRNEAHTLDLLLDSIARQTLAPDETVVVDGGSTDGTLDVLKQWASQLPLRVVEAPGGNISRGRNLAVQAATGELIAVTDAGVRLEPDWLQRLRARLTDEVDVVSGFFKADPCSTFERAMGATVLPDIRDVDPGRFLPSSRSVLFRRSAWQRVGGYPEWLDYCEDLVFDLALKRAGSQFAFAPDAIVWFRPRGSLLAFFRQYYLYARGDGKANLWLIRHFIRYVTYLTAAGLIFGKSPFAWLIIPGAFAYTRRPLQRLQLTGLTATQALYAFSLVPTIRLVGDVAKMLGYPLGVWWRLTRA